MEFREYHQTAKNIISLILVLFSMFEYFCLPIAAVANNATRAEQVETKTYTEVFTVEQPIEVVEEDTISVETTSNEPMVIDIPADVQPQPQVEQSAPVSIQSNTEDKASESEVIEYHSEDTSISHSYTKKLTKSGGVYYNPYTNLKETWYSQRVLPGRGLRIPGRHVNSAGFVCDGDGYICVASSTFSKGTVIETSNGMGKVYDSGCKEGILDVYVNW